jgi:hypothetical protein
MQRTGRPKIYPAQHADERPLWLAASISFLALMEIAVGTLTVKYPGAGGMYLSLKPGGRRVTKTR